MRYVEKCCIAGQATDDYTAHAHCMLAKDTGARTHTNTRTRTHAHTHTHKHKHTHRICNTYCFSTATMVARTRLIVTLHVHCQEPVRAFVWSPCCVSVSPCQLLTNLLVFKNGLDVLFLFPTSTSNNMADVPTYEALATTATFTVAAGSDVLCRKWRRV